MKKRIAVQGFLFSTGALLCLLAPKVFFPDWGSDFFEEIFDTFGLLFILMGLLVRISARGYKAENSLQSDVLVTGGIYKITRNPMYLASFMLGVGLNMCLFNIQITLIFLVIYLIIYVREIRKEKKYLLEHFKNQYEEYCLQTPVFFPNIKDILNLKDYLILKKEWIKKEYNTISIAFTALIILELWQESAFSNVGLLFEELIELSFIVFAFMLLIKAFVFTTKNAKDSV